MNYSMSEALQGAFVIPQNGHCQSAEVFVGYLMD